MIDSQFTYYLLIWMFCTKTDTHMVENVQLKTLQVVYNKYILALDNKLKIYQNHFQFVATEICKSKNKLNPSFMRKT